MENSEGQGKAPFFGRIDWASFWTATVAAFLVYFFTLGPSVGLEDSGELAVAGDHLGVPHPPGYPIWSIISFCLARIFSFVTFRGQPNPAWAIALGSAIFGALAAGCTAMLITRSAMDMLESMEGKAKFLDEKLRRENVGIWRDGLFAWLGGVAGSLVFAFSPVMWSQSTIVEVYSLGAFFLMLVMLLTYRWMRRPGDKLLWITAFVFGLGLTNYQVLLLAALPLVVIIFLRNIALFRDFALVLLPFGLAYLILKLGSLGQQTDLPKRVAIKAKVMIPNMTLVMLGAVALGVSMLVMLASRYWPTDDRLRQKRIQSKAAWISGVFLFTALILLLFAGQLAKSGIVGAENPANIALMEPLKYLRFAWFLAAILGLAAFGAAYGVTGENAARPEGPTRQVVTGAARQVAVGAARPEGVAQNIAARWVYAAVGVLGLIVLGMALALPAVSLPPGMDATAGVPTLGVMHYDLMFALGLILLLGLSATAPRSLAFTLPVVTIELTLYILVHKGVLLGLTHPSTWWFCAPVFFNFALLLLAALTLPRGATVAMTIFMAELGLSFYAYMPIVSDLRNPPMNWGYPRTWEGFKHAITRGQYEAIKPTNILTARFLQQIGDYFIDLRRQFTLLLAPLGFLPFAAWKCFARQSTDGESGQSAAGSSGIAFKWLHAIGLLVLAVVLWAVDDVVAENVISESQSMWLRGLSGVALIASLAIALCKGASPLWLALFLVVATDIFVILGNIPAIERIFDASRIDKLFVGGLLLLAAAGGMLCIARQLWSAARRAMGKESQTWSATPMFDDISQQWMIGTVCNFLVMSIVLIMLANPRGDLQDTFIQKVKFISSHGLYALWIGYGLVFALWLIRRLSGAWCTRKVGGEEEQTGCGQRDRASNALMAAACVAVVMTPLIPIEQNYFNDKLVFELSGAEQNGHDYGWQFGNYQLRGAEAIREELEPDEEPLPNPLYPREMGQGAVFFGGTDPGRFVPTYMIYSADVRPDVFLITQNALADNTFMSVTRDLYGDQLWIPTPKDSEEAFSEFVDDVRSGRRQANSDIVVENGRVQIVGALGVMEINGILCSKIFERNKRWHDFYVEESYVIPWMYPYLTPHGLIMKINSGKTTLTQDNVNDDMDFWDWYIRRMTRDGRYRRDIVAQKSFSKLRSAIAGLYLNRGRYAEGERAYNDARVLYPVSPEAVFRYIQEILMRQRRYDEALEALDYFCAKDPNNERGPYVKNLIEEIKRDELRLAELETRAQERARKQGMPGGTSGVPVAGGEATAEALEMAELYLKNGMTGRARDILKPLAVAPGLSAAECLMVAIWLDRVGDMQNATRAMDRIWRTKTVRNNAESLSAAVRIYEATGDIEKLETLLPLYLKFRPSDWQSWLAMTSIFAISGKMDAAASALNEAVRYGGDKVAPLLESNQTLMQVYRHLLEKRKNAVPGGLPGRPENRASPLHSPLGMNELHQQNWLPEKAVCVARQAAREAA